MGRYSYSQVVLGVKLTHEQATQIKNDDFYGIDIDANYVFLFTDNPNFYSDVDSEYDPDIHVPHYLGVEIEDAEGHLPSMDDVTKQMDNFECYAKPLLDKYGIVDNPALFIVKMVN